MKVIDSNASSIASTMASANSTIASTITLANSTDTQGNYSNPVTTLIPEPRSDIINTEEVMYTETATDFVPLSTAYEIPCEEGWFAYKQFCYWVRNTVKKGIIVVLELYRLSQKKFVPTIRWT